MFERDERTANTTSRTPQRRARETTLDGQGAVQGILWCSAGSKNYGDLQDVSQEILKLISNYKKDSAEKKSQAGYHKIKAKNLNEKWSIIQGNDETIRKTGELPENHEYFTFFNDIKSTVLKYQEAINKDAESLSKKTAKLEDGQRQQPSLDPKNTKVEDGQRQQPTVEPKVTALCRRQKAMIASLYRTLQQPMEHTAVELIRNLWTQIQDVHFRLYEEVEIPEENGYDIKEYLKAERDVQGALAAKSPSECTNDRNLPRITIPKFDGDILKWTQFFDMFVSMVHETNMPTIRKMWYLKTSVVGEAERMIRQIDLKEYNYLHAWNILVDTYDNPRDIETTVLNRFLNQQAINDNVKSLKELYIVTMESLASLKGLGIDISTWDPILIEVLRNKLDSTNKTLYEQSISDSKHIQKLDTMLQFLDQRVRVLATGSKAQNHAKRESKGATCASSSTTRKDCLYCKKPNHVMFRCDDFRSKPVAERLNWVQRQKLCVNCFKADHMAKACQSKYKCFKCDKRHNTLLHLETNSMEPKNPVVASASSKNISLLATAKVVVQGNNGQQATFKALLDSGSQSSLSLKRHDTSLRIEGIGADSAQEAIHIREELVKILRPNGFNLRKWCSNNDQLLHGIPKDDVASDVKFDDSLDSHRIKTLGLIWMPKKDQLCGRAQSSTALKITKRVVCSELAQIFDPLGLFAPVVVKAKIFMQRLWEDKLELHEHNLWLYGPLFLHGSPDKWTAPFIITPSNLERKTKHISLAISPSTIGEDLYTCRHSNSFYKLQRIVAYMLRFCYKGYRATTTTLCTKELDRSRNLILRTIQQAEFPADLKMLQRYNTVDRKSSISSLSPVLGSEGLMRVGGRLEQAPLPYNAKHQILLPYNDPIVKMILRELHEDNMHCAHFLIGETLTAPPDVNADRNEKSLLKRWELVSRLKQGFWKQWSEEYLQELQRLMSPTISSTMLILLLMLPLVLAQSVSVTKFDTKPGIYYEKIGQTMRAISDWTMVIYYDLDPYWRDMKTFNSGISEFQYLCPEVNNKPTCDSISQHYRHLYDELQMANVLMQHTRKRRSPFDAVGNIANSLFGVLDSNYANEMTKVIKKVQTNEEFVLSLLKNQTSILDSTINVVKKTRATSDKRLRLLEQQVAAIADSRGKDQFMGLTHDDLRRCFALPNEEYICFDHQAVFNVNNRCEFQLFNNKTPTMCQTTHRTTKMVWEKTYQPNKWIFATRSTMELQAVCNGTPTTIQLEDTGVLSLSSGCTARNFEISISTFGNIISQTRQSYVRFGDIVKPNNTIAPAPKINTPNYTVQEDKDLDDLQLKLATLKNQELPNQISSVQHHHIAAYAALVVSIILLCAYALRKQRLWTLRPTATRNETANPSAPSASPRRFAQDLNEG
ncbi:hypothetical protein ACLKA7_001457 [Drosophila subpalustris]